MVQTNIIEKDGSEKDGYKAYDVFSNNVMMDCHMVGAHLRAIHALIGKIQNEAHDDMSMPVKEDVSSASLLLNSASDKLDLILAALDDSSYRYALKPALAGGAQL